MVVPVIEALAKNSSLQVTALALTTAQGVFKRCDIPYISFKDFIDLPEDAAMLEWGKKLMAELPQRSDIPVEETLAYLGSSYQELVEEEGEEQASWRYKEEGRQCFLPLKMLRRVFDHCQPDLVVTTNSPRAEKAAVRVAKERGIPSLSMVDLFGVGHFNPLEADYITVLDKKVIENMKAEGVKTEGKQFFTAGNPAFDAGFKYRDQEDKQWLVNEFPGIALADKTVLWLDMPAYWEVEERRLYTRSKEDILHDLNMLHEASESNSAVLLVRPHPSQDAAFYHRWIEEKKSNNIYFAGEQPLHPLLATADVSVCYTSTAGVEAVNMKRKLLQLLFHQPKSDVPLGEWDLAWLARKPEEVKEQLRRALYDENDWERIQENINAFMPKELAGPKIASLIQEIIAA